MASPDVIARWIGGDTVGAADALRAQPEVLVASTLMGHVVAAAVRVAHEHNQFRVIDDDTQAALHARVEQTVAQLRAANGDREAMVAALTADARARAALLATAAPAVTCGTYAVTLQLDVLGLDAASLVGPLLDVGCGPAGLLVAALRARGIDAHGVDRHIDAPTAWLREVDWQGAVPSAASHGTVVSHLALSLHFLHHHIAGTGGGETARTMAKTWVGLTRALRAGGVLAYAPGLPMLERMLDQREFAVARLPLPSALEATLTPLACQVGEDVAYAAQVRRR